VIPKEFWTVFPDAICRRQAQNSMSKFSLCVESENRTRGMLKPRDRLNKSSSQAVSTQYMANDRPTK
jgi:hypothetical protein